VKKSINYLPAAKKGEKHYVVYRGFIPILMGLFYFRFRDYFQVEELD